MRKLVSDVLGQRTKVPESISAGAKDFAVEPFQPGRVLEAVGKALG
jgi:DNA-binding NtrC family response regulator